MNNCHDVSTPAGLAVGAAAVDGCGVGAKGGIGLLDAEDENDGIS